MQLLTEVKVHKCTGNDMCHAPSGYPTELEVLLIVAFQLYNQACVARNNAQKILPPLNNLRGACTSASMLAFPSSADVMGQGSSSLTTGSTTFQFN